MVATPAQATSSGGESSGESAKVKSATKTVKPLSKKRLEKHLADAENKGVCYISRVPPFLKPDALRTMLSGLGTEVLRIYLAPESAQQRAGRVRAGGNKKKSFTEGWVEFEDKRRAKRIASTLNNSRMSNDKRSFYYHDLWNIKYLHKFKWNHLTEKIAYEARVRRDKMVAELTAAKKESSFYMRKVEQAKAIDAMEERKRKRSANEGAPAAEAGAAAGAKNKRMRGAEGDASAGGSGGGAAAAGDADLQNLRRKFKQRKVATDPAKAVGNGLGALAGLLRKRDDD